MEEGMRAKRKMNEGERKKECERKEEGIRTKERRMYED